MKRHTTSTGPEAPWWLRGLEPKRSAMTQKPLTDAVGVSSSPVHASLLSGRTREGLWQPVDRF